MALITRLTRLFRADAHALLDQLEEPEALLRQALREMDEALAQGQARLREREQRLEQLQRRRHDIETRLAGIGSELDLCLAAGNEALARLLLRRRLEGERLAEQLARQRERLAAEQADARARLADQQQRLEQLRQRAAVFDHADDSSEAPWRAEDIIVSDADVELALLREKQRRAS